MAVESSMLPLGTQAPDFNLLDVVSGSNKTLKNVRGEKGLVVAFICAHCPYVKNLEEELSLIAKSYTNLGVKFVAISSNDVEHYPDDAPEKLKVQAEQNEFVFPYLYDETQEIAKLYQAVCTPDFFLFDKDLKCIYRGRFDSSTPGNNEPVSGDELSAAIDDYLNDEPIDENQMPSLGCSIKWKN